MADRTVRAIFEARVTNAQQGMRTLSADVDKTGRKVDGLQKDLTALGKTKTTPKIDADIREAEKKKQSIERELEDLHGMEVTPEVTADIAEAEKRLAEVDAALEGLHGQRAEAEVTADASRAQSEIGTAEAALDRVDGTTATARVDADTAGARQAADEIPPIFKDAGAEAGDMLGDALGGKLKNLSAVGIIGGAAAALGAFIGSEIRRGLDNEMGEDRMAAAAGLDPATARRAGEAAGDAWVAGFGETETDLMGIADRAFRAGVVSAESSVEEIRYVLEKAQGAFDTWGLDTGQTITAVGNMLRTGLVSSAEEAFDLIYTAQSQLVFDDATETLQEYSSQFVLAGITGADALGLISQAADAGARNTDLVGDALKELGLRAREGTDPARDALDDLGLNAEQMVRAFQQGGPAARDAMGQVFDALRRVRDEGGNTQEIIANLFGGPGEDLGVALFALDVGTAADALGGLDSVTGQADRTLDTLTSNLNSGTTAALRGMRQEVTEAGQAYANPMKAALDFAEANDEVGDSATRAVVGTSNLGAATEALAQEAAATADAQAELDDSTADTNLTLEEQANLLAILIDSHAALSGQVMGATEAEGKFWEAVRAADESVEKHGKTLDVTTEAGYKNTQALHGIAEAGWAQVEAMQEVGATEGELQGVLDTTREKFVAQAMQMGLSEEQANAYADEVGLLEGALRAIPENTRATITIDDAEAQRRLEWWKRQKVTVGVNFVSGSQSGSLGSPTAPYIPGGRHAGGWVNGGLNSGGWVPGPTAAVDNVLWPVLPGRASGGMLAQPLTGGEYVVNATSAAQNAALLEVLNSSRHTLNIGGGGGSTRLDASDIARLASALATAVRPAVREGAREGFQSQLTGAMLSIRAGEW